MLTKPQHSINYTNNISVTANGYVQGYANDMPTAKQALGLWLRQQLHPWQHRRLCIHLQTTFYGRLYTQRVTLPILSISLLSLARLSLTNIYVCKTLTGFDNTWKNLYNNINFWTKFNQVYIMFCTMYTSI